MMKKLFLLLFISFFANGEELRLICDGVITETETDVIYGTTKEPSGATKLNTTFYDKELKKTQATIFLDLNLNFERLISKQKILIFLKYLLNAAADAPEYDPISNKLICFDLNFLK